MRTENKMRNSRPTNSRITFNSAINRIPLEFGKHKQEKTKTSWPLFPWVAVLCTQLHLVTFPFLYKPSAAMRQRSFSVTVVEPLFGITSHLALRLFPVIPWLHSIAFLRHFFLPDLDSERLCVHTFRGRYTN